MNDCARAEFSKACIIMHPNYCAQKGKARSLNKADRIPQVNMPPIPMRVAGQRLEQHAAAITPLRWRYACEAQPSQSLRRPCCDIRCASESLGR
eukprot:6197583-Pleurochrysis_carterae.AAC.2